MDTEKRSRSPLSPRLASTTAETWQKEEWAEHLVSGHPNKEYDGRLYLLDSHVKPLGVHCRILGVQSK